MIRAACIYNLPATCNAAKLLFDMLDKTLTAGRDTLCPPVDPGRLFFFQKNFYPSLSFWWGIVKSSELKVQRRTEHIVCRCVLLSALF